MTKIVDELIIDNHLKLRKLKNDDLENYFKVNTSDSAKKGFMAILSTLNGAREELSEIIAEYSSNEPNECGYAIEYRGEFAGVATLEGIGRKRFEHVANIAYSLLPKYMCKGIGTLAVRKLCDYGFETFPLTRIEATVATQNIASNKLLEKVGFVLEGMKRNSCNYQYLGLVDENIYALLKKEDDYKENI